MRISGQRSIATASTPSRSRVVLDAAAAAEHVAHRPGGEQRQRGAVGAGREQAVVVDRDGDGRRRPRRRRGTPAAAPTSRAGARAASRTARSRRGDRLVAGVAVDEQRGDGRATCSSVGWTTAAGCDVPAGRRATPASRSAATPARARRRARAPVGADAGDLARPQARERCGAAAAPWARPTPPRSSFGARFWIRVPQYGHSVMYGDTSAPQLLQTRKRSGSARHEDPRFYAAGRSARAYSTTAPRRPRCPAELA